MKKTLLLAVLVGLELLTAPEAEAFIGISIGVPVAPAPYYYAPGPYYYYPSGVVYVHPFGYWGGGYYRGHFYRAGYYNRYGYGRAHYVHRR